MFSTGKKVLGALMRVSQVRLTPLPCKKNWQKYLVHQAERNIWYFLN
jgi:hypothetical protein